MSSTGGGPAGEAKATAPEAVQPQERAPIETAGGQVLQGSPESLRDQANQALKDGDVKKATHLYTRAIHLLAKDMPRDENGVAADADLLALNESSKGLLAKLLSNRSMTYLKQGDTEGAIEDAETCTRAEPSFEKGQLRLAVALEAANAPLQRQLEACERGIESCPTSQVLVQRKWKLKKSIAEQVGAGKPQDSDGGRGDSQEARLRDAYRVADDEAHPRRHEAAADLGNILAEGAFGLQRDAKRAEHYLRIGAKGGEVAAQRHLGLLLLREGRPVEAAKELNEAAAAGDEQAAGALQQLMAEVREKEAQARSKLEEMAEAGDNHAREMLQELRERDAA